MKNKKCFLYLFLFIVLLISFLCLSFLENNEITKTPSKYIITLEDIDHLNNFSSLNPPANHEYQSLGATVKNNSTEFKIWLPHAQNVEILTSLTNWQRGKHPLRFNKSSGMWTGSINGLSYGDMYKLGIIDSKGVYRQRVDPFSKYLIKHSKQGWVEKLWNHEAYQWSPAQNKFSKHISIMEVHLDTRFPESDLSYPQIAKKLIPLLRQTNINTISLLPITHHSSKKSWGYIVGGFFSLNYRHGSPDQFKEFIDIMHQNGIRVIIDLVQAHAASELDVGLSFIDGTDLYFRHGLMGVHPMWGSKVFAYERKWVRDFLLNQAIYWVQNYKIDGFRIDALSTMINLDYGRGKSFYPEKRGSKLSESAQIYLKDLVTSIRKINPYFLFIAEDDLNYSGLTEPIHNGGMGFDFRWDMGLANHMRLFLSNYKKNSLKHLSLPLTYKGKKITYVNSHDETSQGKRYFISLPKGETVYNKLALSRMVHAYIYFMIPGVPMIFQGGEYAKEGWWDENTPIDLEKVLNWEVKKKYPSYISALNYQYKTQEVFRNYKVSSARVILEDNKNKIFAVLRSDKNIKNNLIIVQNWSDKDLPNIKLPHSFNENSKIVFHSNKAFFGGNAKEPIITNMSKTNDDLYLSIPAYTTVVIGRKENTIN